MKFSNLLALTCVAVLSSASAFSAQQILQSLILDNDLSPTQRFLSGVRNEGGAHSVHNSIYCSAKAAERHYGPKGMLAPDNLIYIPSTRATRRAVNMAQGLADNLQKVFSFFAERGDPQALSRRVCAGIYDTGEVNAESSSDGYIFLDPRLIEFYNNVEGRTEVGLSQVFYHELAHQVQFWNGHPFEKDPTVKLKELTADCMGAALVLAIFSINYGKNYVETSVQGAIALSASLGDIEYNNPNHHGTTQERQKATREGLNWMQMRLRKDPTLKGLTLRETLDQCTMRAQLYFKP